MEANEKVTILDEYKCSILEDRIRVEIDSPRDPSLVDIMSELYNSDGVLYFDGSYYVYNNAYEMTTDARDNWYLDLLVK